jgi:hypothetical protein
MDAMSHLSARLYRIKAVDRSHQNPLDLRSDPYTSDPMSLIRDACALMKRYCAKLLFQFRVTAQGVSGKRRLCEERMVLINARSAKGAVALAKRQGSLFIRYAPLVKKRGGRVVVECPDILTQLFSSVAGIDLLVVEGAELPAFDVHAPLRSLPYLVGSRLETVPAEVPYLSVAAGLVERWRDRLPGDLTFKVGIVWQGNPHHKWDRHRSVPLAQFAPLAAVPCVQLISLQRGDAEAALRSLNGRFRVTEWEEPQDPESGTFAETAAVMMNLDLVVTVDTAVAHLAGALALPVWVALSAIVDWRWLLERPDTPWYPTMRLFRQAQLGDWDSVFARMADELRTLIAREAVGGSFRVQVGSG